MNLTPNVTFFRHGATNYTEEDDDLTPKGVAQVEASAEALARDLVPGQSVVVMSSPRSRAQYTARIIVRVLAGHGFDVSDDRIATVPALDEVCGGFSWPLLSSLVNGGSVTFGDVTYEIDPKLTNPAGLSVGKYFNSDAAHKMSLEARQQLPAGYLAHVDAMESFTAVVDRFLSLLTDLYGVNAARVVLAGHDATAGYPAEIFSGGTLTGIQPGESLDISFFDGSAYVTRVGELREGRSDVDLFDEYIKFF